MTTINLINWTIHEAEQLVGEQLVNKSAAYTVVPLPAFSAVLENEAPEGGNVAGSEGEIHAAWRAEEALPRGQHDSVAGAAETASPASAQVATSARAEAQPVQIMNVPAGISLTSIKIAEASPRSATELKAKSSDSPSATQLVGTTSPEIQKEVPESSLLRAIKQSDYRTPKVDRERAIVLRWLLRDILAKRLNLSPPSHEDLQTLIALGLIEMQGSEPVLTQEGLSVIA